MGVSIHFWKENTNIIIHVHNSVLWIDIILWKIPLFKLNAKNILLNIVTPTKQCYDYE